MLWLIRGTRTLIVCLLILPIVGCGGAYSRQTNNQLRSKIDTEKAAWQQTEAMAQKNCYPATSPAPRDQAVEIADCYANYARTYVVPVAFRPVATNELLADYKEISIKYEQGKLGRDEGHLAMQRAWNAYLAKIDGAATDIQRTAYQADVIAAQQRQTALQNMANELNRQQQNSMKTTNCRFIGDMMQCTEF